MRRGARDFVTKPWDNTRLLTTLRTQVELSRALRRSDNLEDESRRRQDGRQVVDRAPHPQPAHVAERQPGARAQSDQQRDDHQRPRFLDRLIDHNVHVDPAIFATGGALR